MKFIALAFLGVALATYSTPTLPVPLKVNTEYRYRFEGSLESGLPVKSDGSNTRINCNVIFQVTDDQTVLCRLQDIKIAADHKTSEKKIRPIEDLESRILADEHQQYLETPVKFHYKHGMISQLQFNPEEPVWSANIKRAVINMIQINIKKVGREMEEETNVSERINDYFTASEKNVEGDCQVAYTTVEDKEDHTIVTKSINFDKCTNRPEVRYNFRYFSDCEKCSSPSRAISPQTVYTYKIVKDQLKEVDLISTYTVQLESSTLNTEVRSRLVLEGSSEIRSEIEVPQGEKEEIIYNTAWEEKVERFFKNGDEKDNMIFASFATKIELVEKIIVEASKIDKNDAEMVHILARLVRAFRMSSMHDLKTTHQNVFATADHKQKSLMEHALAIAGTKNTIEHLLHHILSGDISPRHAVQHFKEMQDTVYPSVAIADMLVDFANNQIVTSEPALRQSVWLCIGSIVRGVVSPKNEIDLVQENTRAVKEKYLRIFTEELEKSTTTYEKILFVKTLANADIDISVSTFEKIIKDRKEETILRIEAIDGLRLIGEQMPRKVQRILMPIYTSTSEKPEIRMGALIIILKTQPEQAMLSQIIFNLNREPNQEVAVFTHKTLTSIAKSTNPCYSIVSSRIAPLLAETQFKNNKKVLSYFKSLSFFENNLSGLTINLVAMFGKHSDLPKHFITSVDALSNKKWTKGFMQLGMSQQNIEQLWTKLVNKINKIEKKITRGSRISQPINLIKELARKMKIRVRSNEREDPYAQIYLRYKQMDYAVLPIDEQIIDQIVEKFLQDRVISLKHLLDITEEFNFHHAAFLQEDVVKIPTSLGLPLGITSKTPSVFSVQGTITSEFTKKGISIRLIAEPNWAVTQLNDVRTWTPLLEQGVKEISTCKSQLPIDLSMDVNTHKGVEIQFKHYVPKKDVQLVYCSSRPVAFFRFPKHNNLKAFVEVQEMTIRQPNWEEKINENSNVFEGYSHKITLRNWKVEELVSGESEFNLVVEPTSRSSRYVFATIKVDEQKKERIEIPKIEAMLDKVMNVEYEDSESRTEEIRREEMQKYVREIPTISTRVLLTAGTEDEKITVDFRAIADERMRFFRYILNTRLPTEYSEWNLKSKVDILLPVQHEGINYEKIGDFKHREIQVACEAVWGTQEKNSVNIKMQLEQTKEHRQWTKTTEIRGIEGSEQTMEASRLNQIKAVIEYNLPSKSSQIAYDRLCMALRREVPWTATTEQIEGTEGRLVLQLTADQKSNSVNFKIHTPEELIQINEISMPYMVLPSIIRSPISQMRRSVYENAECEIRRNKISTFDDVIYSAPITTCWSVVAKDCSEEPQFVVMVKNVNKVGSEKKVKIINNEHTYELELVKDEMVVRVNNKIVRGSSEEYSIERFSSYVVLVELKEVSVRFDGETVKVELSNTQMNTQCGLCGHFNGEKSSELRTASDEETDDIERVHRSFIVKHEECDMDEEILSEKKNYKMYGNEEDEYDYEMDKKPLRKNKKIAEPNEYQEEETESETSVPEKKTHIIEFSHRICFSLEPIATCPTNKINFRAAEKKVKFTCLPRHEPEARRLKNESRTSPLHIQHMPVSFVENVLVPQACEVY